MATKKIAAELELLTKDAQKAVDALNKKLKETGKETDNTKKKGISLTGTLGKGFKGLGKAVGTFGNALKSSQSSAEQIYFYYQNTKHLNK